MGPGDAKALRQRLVAAEQSRRAAARQARERARALQLEEERRLREWEGELVGADALPAMLGAPRRLVERWIGEGLIPVARSTTIRRGGKRFEELEFHPDQIAALLPQVAKWKAAGRSRMWPGRECRTGSSRGGRGSTGMRRISRRRGRWSGGSRW